MELQRISNNALKRFARIGDRKYQRRYGEFLVEGVRLIEEAFRASARVVEMAVVPGAEKDNRIKGLIRKALSSNSPVWRVTPGQLGKICRTSNNQGVAAGIALPGKAPGDIYGELLQIKSGIVLLLDGLQDPGNIGTLIRCCEAFGVSGVILAPESAGLYNPKTIRSTMGAIFRVPVAEMHDRPTLDIIRGFSRSGFKTIAADTGKKAIDLRKAPRFKRALLVIGREASGLADEVVENVDVSISIPMPGPTESLNAAIAGSIIMFQLTSEAIEAI